MYSKEKGVKIMSIHINQVLDYLDNQRVCQQADNMESLMGLLHDAYCIHNSTDNRQLREYEQLAFTQGVVVGMLVMTEVNRVP